MTNKVLDFVTYEERLNEAAARMTLAYYDYKDNNGSEDAYIFWRDFENARDAYIAIKEEFGEPVERKNKKVEE